MKCVLVLLFLMSAGRSNARYTEEDNAQLPRLFHLDDHDRCVLLPGGLYCLGEFDLAPVGQSRMYENIQKYTANNPLGFNRSKLYRGYCVSVRCPTAIEKNASHRFENCVNERARRYALTARLRKLQYCKTQQQHAAKAQQPPDAAQQLFLKIIYALLSLNFVGTVYDIATGDDKNKNGIISAWSVRASWRRLTATYDDGDPRLTQLESIQGMRVLTMMITIYAHISVLHYQFYVISPRYLEILFRRADGVILSAGTSLIQLFVMLSSFLTAYNMLLYAEKHTLSFLMLPVLVVKRVIRIAPVHLLVVGFVATYWPKINYSVFSATMEENSASCRRQFWAHAFFLNNIFDRHDNDCLMPSWFLPVDMHLFILTSALTILMYRRRRQALRLYVALFIISALANGVVAYLMGYHTMIYDSIPEVCFGMQNECFSQLTKKEGNVFRVKIRGLFRESKSFGEFYTSTWGSLPACFLGMLLAHLHYELQQTNYDWSQHKWFERVQPWIIPIGTVITLVLALIAREYTQPWATALFLTVDRPIVISLLFTSIIGGINFNGSHRWFYGWRGWRVPARLSLPMMLCHWLVSVAVAARPVAYHTSTFDVSVDYLATLFYSYTISILLALLVEIPVQRFFAQFF